MSDAMTDMRNNKKLRDEIESLRQQLAAAQEELHFQACLTRDLLPYQERAVKAEQQLAEREKQVLVLREFVKLLRDYIPASAVGNMTVQEALAATADLDGLILCEKKPFEFRWELRNNGFVQQWDITPLYRAWEPK